jgi:hypothetical protein
VSLQKTSAIQQLESLVLGRAGQDAQFRQALLADPREAISQELGIELPGTVKIDAVETASGQIALTLPPDLDASLSLAAVAGSDCCECCCC